MSKSAKTRLEHDYDKAQERLLRAYRKLASSEEAQELVHACIALGDAYASLSDEYEDKNINDRYCFNIACSVNFPLIGRATGNAENFRMRRWGSDNEELIYAQAAASGLGADIVDLKETFDDLLINE